MSGVVVAQESHRACEPATRQVEGMLAALWGPAVDGFARWTGAHVALGRAGMATTPEEREAEHGIVARGSIRVAADARLDDRETVCRALSLSACTSDSAILAAAWERWEERTVLEVLGDYVFAVWDERSGTVSLVRDAIGMRPFYFATTRDGLIAATEVHALGRGPWALDFALDRREAARFLVDRHTATDRSVFENVRVVPPGSVTRFSRGTLTSTTRVWSPDAFARAPSADLASNVDRVRTILRTAVEDRLRSIDAPAVLLSGGVDSSVVACAIRDVRPLPGRLHLHLGQPGHAHDESHHFARVVEAVGGRGVMLDPRRYMEQLGPDSDLIAPGELYDVSATMMVPLLVPEAPRRRAVVVSGVGSDDLLEESGSEALTHFSAGRLRAAWRSARRVAPEQGGMAVFVARQMARLVMPTTARGWVRRLRPHRWAWPPWLTREARAELDRWHRETQLVNERLPAPDPIQRGFALTLTGAYDLHLIFARNDFQARVCGVEERCPYYDRRVVETLLALPHVLRFDGNLAKPILRAAGAGSAPAENLARTDSTHFSEFVDEVRRGPHHAAWAARLKDAEVERLGIVRAGWLAAALEDQPSDRLLTRAMSLEIALRTIRAPAQRSGEDLRTRARAVAERSFSPLAARNPTRQGNP